MPMTIKLVKSLEGFMGDARLYKLSSPVIFDEDKQTEYVILSAVTVSFTNEPETYIFPATADGEIADWTELSGSLRGTLQHIDAIRNAGWTLLNDEA